MAANVLPRAIAPTVVLVPSGMTIDPSDPGFMRPEPENAGDAECAHDFPAEWDYTHDPAGSKKCRKCGRIEHD